MVNLCWNTRQQSSCNLFVIIINIQFICEKHQCLMQLQPNDNQVMITDRFIWQIICMPAFFLVVEPLFLLKLFIFQTLIPAWPLCEVTEINRDAERIYLVDYAIISAAVTFNPVTNNLHYMACLQICCRFKWQKQKIITSSDGGHL